MTAACMHAPSQKCVQIFATPCMVASQILLIATVSRSLLRLKSIELVMLCYLTISPSASPFSWLQSFPKPGSFPMCRFFASGGQSIGTLALASVLPMNIQDWFPLGLTGLIFRSLGREDPLEKEMATHSSTLAWRIPWREEPGRLQSMGSQRVEHNWVTSLLLFKTNSLTSFSIIILTLEIDCLFIQNIYLLFTGVIWHEMNNIKSWREIVYPS